MVRGRLRACNSEETSMTALADQPPPWPRVHAPVPAARSAQVLAQGPLLRPVAPHEARTSRPRPPLAATRPPNDRAPFRGDRGRCRHARGPGATSDLPALQTRPPCLHSAPFPQAGVRAMTLGAVSSEQHNCPLSPLCMRRQHAARCCRGCVIGGRSYGVQTEVPATIPTPTRNFFLTAARRPVAAPCLQTDCRRPKLPSRARDLKNP